MIDLNNQDVHILKPNIAKIFLKNFLKLLTALLIISLLFIYIYYIKVIDSILEVFNQFGVQVDSKSFFIIFWAVVFGLFMILLLMNYIITRKTVYKFYWDKMVMTESAFLVFIESHEVPFKNIVRVSYSDDGFFNTFFKTGSITIELSGMKIKDVEIEFIDNIKGNIEFVHNIISRYRAVKQAQFDEKFRIKKILEPL
ncbi:MAG: hypothetical protein ABII01_04035 [Candidatus Woesearchaeota archaeon]